MIKDSIIPYAIINSVAQLDNIYEVRIFGWIIAKAQAVLKLYNKDLSEINMQYALDLVRVTMPARYLLVEGDQNYTHITKSFSLANKTIDYEREGITRKINIIAFPEYITKNGRSHVTFVIHNELWHALLNFTKGYRLINLHTYMKLRSAYSVIMFMIVSQQKDPMHYHIDTLKRILGCQNKKAYERGNNFFAKVIDRAKKELDEKSPFTFEYTASRSGKAGRYMDVVIIPKTNTPKEEEAGARTEQLDKALDNQRCRLDDRVIDYLSNAFLMSAREIETIEGQLLPLGDWAKQLAFIADVKQACDRKRVKNYAGYLVTSLRNRT